MAELDPVFQSQVYKSRTDPPLLRDTSFGGRGIGHVRLPC